MSKWIPALHAGMNAYRNPSWLYPVPQNAPYVGAGMNVPNIPKGNAAKATDVSPWYGVYRNVFFLNFAA